MGSNRKVIFLHTPFLRKLSEAVYKYLGLILLLCLNRQKRIGSILPFNNFAGRNEGVSRQCLISVLLLAADFAHGKSSNSTDMAH